MNCEYSIKPLDARKALTDVLAPYNPKNKDRRLHRHPAFFGTMAECLEDCCEVRTSFFGAYSHLNLAQCCVEPKTDEEKKLQETEDDTYVRGRIQYAQCMFRDVLSHSLAGSSKRTLGARASRVASIQ